MYKILVVAYGGICYLVFLGAFLYAIGFVGNVGVPKSIDTGDEGSMLGAVTVDLVLLAVFGLQHSIMARPGFKQRWTQIIPAVIERSTYVLASSLALMLLFWQWRPLPQVVWDIAQPFARILVWIVFWLGWLVVLVSTFLIDHFDLFGLRQVYLFASDRPYTPLGFKTPSLYRFVRHPIMVGFVIAFWATPSMTVAHVLFAAVCTLYILAAIRLEERDLLTYYGDEYARYRRQVRMLLPIRKRTEAS